MAPEWEPPAEPEARPRSRAARVALVLVLVLVGAVGAVVAGVAAVQDEGDPSPGSQSQSAGTSVEAELTPAPREEPSGPALLLPNVRSLAAHDVRVQRTGSGRLLRFSASLANVGAGPLLLVPLDTPGCAAGRHPAAQVLHLDRDRDGVFQRDADRPGPQQRVRCMLEHADHDHWHFDAMARYALRDPVDGRVLAERDKVSFCLRDNRQVEGQPVNVPKEHYGECSRHEPQGISPGWVDVYLWDLAGQTLRLPDDVDGRRLCLDLEADPRGVLRESDEEDNANSVALRVRGGEVVTLGSHGCV